MAKKRARLTDTQVEDITSMSRVEDILNLGDLEQLPVSMIPIDRIDPNPFQPRQLFDPERITELATAMQANGFLGSLVAREVDGRYQLAFGERRLRAANEANIDRIPLHISNFTDEQMAEVAITENVNREDLTPIEEASGYQVLYEQFEYSYRNIGHRVGKSHAHIIQMLNLLKYDEIKEAVEQDRITASAASELVKVTDKVARRRLLEEVAAKGLGRDALRAAVKMANESPSKAEATTPESKGDSEPSKQLAQDVYDVVPTLYASLRALKSVQQNRLKNVPELKKADAKRLLDELDFLSKQIKNGL